MTQTQRQFVFAYAILLFFCAILLILSDFLGPIARSALIPIAGEGFNLVLGALIGALSAMLGTSNDISKNKLKNKGTGDSYGK